VRFPRYQKGLLFGLVAVLMLGGVGVAAVASAAPAPAPATPDVKDGPLLRGLCIINSTVPRYQNRTVEARVEIRCVAPLLRLHAEAQLTRNGARFGERSSQASPFSTRIDLRPTISGVGPFGLLCVVTSVSYETPDGRVGRDTARACGSPPPGGSALRGSKPDNREVQHQQRLEKRR